MAIFESCPSCGASLPAGIPEKLKRAHIIRCTRHKENAKIAEEARKILDKLDNIRTAQGADDPCYNADEQ